MRWPLRRPITHLPRFGTFRQPEAIYIRSFDQFIRSNVICEIDAKFDLLGSGKKFQPIRTLFPAFGQIRKKWMPNSSGRNEAQVKTSE